jgi:hypothetical protein
MREREKGGREGKKEGGGGRKEYRKEVWRKEERKKKKKGREGGARWIVDIRIPQWWLTTLKKEDQVTPKGTMESHNQQETKPSPNSQIEKQLNYRNNGKNDSQPNTPNPPPLKSSYGWGSIYLVLALVSPASRHTQKLWTPHSPILHDLLPSPWNTREISAPV